MNAQTLKAPDGINHLAINTSDMKAMLEYFNEVLGLPLVALYWMHGAENTIHGFLKLNDESLLAFVGSPNITADIEYGVTHPGNATAAGVGGTLQHIAFNVSSLEDLLLTRDRIREKGVHCFGPLDHGFTKSIYFSGPEGITLEIAYMTGADVTQWIDPTAVEAVGFSDEELARLISPDPYHAPSEPQPNAPSASASPHRMFYPEDIYELMLNTPDEVTEELMRDNVPPTAKPEGEAKSISVEDALKQRDATNQ